MAKRKLSDSQRKALREDIREKIASGVPRTDLVKSLSSKYGISPISMRWYLRTQPADLPEKTDSHASSESQAALQAPAEDLSQEPLTKALIGKGSGKAEEATLLELLNGLTHHKIKRLMEARKLMPKLQVFRRHQVELKDQIRQLEKRLESEAGKARGVEAQIKRLAGF